MAEDRPKQIFISFNKVAESDIAEPSKHHLRKPAAG